MVIKFFILLLLIVSIIPKQQLWVQYPLLNEEEISIHKYVHRIRNGYFVDIGGYNPIQYSNTIKLTTWFGLIVEASEKESLMIRDQFPHIQVLNLAVSNTSGNTVWLTKSSTDPTASKILGKTQIESQGVKISSKENVTTITMADLCHKYYKAKPTYLNIDIQGAGEQGLASNDWKNEKCIPDIIYVEDTEYNIKAEVGGIRKLLQSNNYTITKDKIQLNSVYIHNSKLQFYKKQAEANAQYIANIKPIQWNEFASKILGQLLDIKFNPKVNPGTQPAFLYYRQLQLIDIVEITRFSNLIYERQIFRPIIIMEYDQDISTIYLGTTNFTSTEVIIDSYKFQAITAFYTEGFYITVYVFDHQKHENFVVNIFEKNKDKIETIELYPSIIKVVTNSDMGIKKTTCENDGVVIGSIDKYIIISLLIILSLLLCFVSYQDFKNKKSKLLNLAEQEGNSQRTQQKL